MMSDKLKSNFSDVKISVVISLLAWPICYFVETGIVKVDQDKQALVMMGVGFILLTSIVVFAGSLSKEKNWMQYVFTVFAFTSMIDLIIGFELKGWIHGFMSQYLFTGEPYLNSPWGCAIVLFDGTFFYSIYLILIHRISNRESWRSVGIFWVSAIVNSMIVLLFGVAAGQHAPTFCTFLNIPYALFPIFIGIRSCSKYEDPNWSVERKRSNGLVYDIAVSIGLMYSIWIVFSKSMLSIGSQFQIFQNILIHEQALLDVNPAPFARIQSLVYLFYALPILIISLAYTFRKRKPQFVWDLALLNGGVMVQGQFSFIVTALDSHTPTQLRSDPMDWTFWINNLSLLIVSQVFLWSLYKSHIGNVCEGHQAKKNK